MPRSRQRRTQTSSQPVQVNLVRSHAHTHTHTYRAEPYTHGAHFARSNYFRTRSELGPVRVRVVRACHFFSSSAPARLRWLARQRFVYATSRAQSSSDTLNCMGVCVMGFIAERRYREATDFGCRANIGNSRHTSLRN